MQFDAALAAGNCRSLDSQVGGAEHFRPPSPFPAHSLAAGTCLPLSCLFLFFLLPPLPAAGIEPNSVVVPGVYISSRSPRWSDLDFLSGRTEKAG